MSDKTDGHEEDKDSTTKSEPVTNNDERVAQLEKQVKSLESSKAGLSGHATTLKKKYDELVKVNGTLSEQVAALETDSEAKISTLQQEFEAMKLEHEQLTGEHTSLKRRSELGVKIRTEFPQLAGLYDEGLLRVDDMEEEQLAEYLKKYAEKVSTIKELGIEEIRSGSTPPAPSSSTPAVVSLDEAQDNIQKALTQHGINSEEYKEQYQTYVDAVMLMGKKENK